MVSISNMYVHLAVPHCVCPLSVLLYPPPHPVYPSWLPVPSVCIVDSAPGCPPSDWLQVPSICTVDSAPMCGPPVCLVVCVLCMYSAPYVAHCVCPLSSCLCSTHTHTDTHRHTHTYTHTNSLNGDNGMMCLSLVV